MKLDFSMERFSPEIRDSYLHLLPNQQQAVERGKLEWKFAKQPTAKGLIAVCRSNEHGIVGLNAFMPSKFRIASGDKILGYQSMDTIVDPVARGKGVFTRLINAFYDDNDGSFLYGFPNLNSSPGFFGKLGWTYLSSVPMLIKPLRTGYFLKKVARFLPDFPLPELSVPSLDASEIDAFDENVSDAWDAFAKRHELGLAIQRDLEYLNWRLNAHPSEKYTLLNYRNRSFTAGTVAAKHGGNVGYVMDAFGEDSDLPGLIRALTDSFRQRNADVALAWCQPHSPNYGAYRKAGFLPFPNRIRPIKLNFGARPRDVDMPFVTDPAKWYISYLDSDTV